MTLSAGLMLAGVVKVWPDPHRPHRLGVGELTIAAGDHVLLTGPSGAGKSTLLDILALNAPPDQAAQFEVHVAGTTHHPLALPPRTRRRLRQHLIAYCAQPDTLLPFLTLADNIALAARLTGPLPGMDPATVIEALGLTAHLGKRPGSLSGGQRRRGSLARALLQATPILVADEPTADLDSDTAGQVRDLLRASDRTIIVASHDPVLMAAGPQAWFHRVVTVSAGGQLSAVG